MTTMSNDAAATKAGPNFMIYGPQKLPVEIQDIIVDFLSSNRPALQALTLTNRHFRSLAQPKCLSKITLKINTNLLKSVPDPISPRSFLDLLDTSPHIASYVRSISIIQPPCELPRPTLAARATETKVIEEIMSRTHNIRDLCFPVSSYRDGALGFLPLWSTLEEGLRTLIAKFYQKKSTYPRTVDLRAFSYVPEQVLSSFRDIRNLHIAPLDIPTQAAVGTASQGNEAQPDTLNVLNTLELCFYEDWNSWEPTLQFLRSPTSNFDLTRLGTLITSMFLTSAQLESILLLCSENLRHLVLQTGPNINSLMFYNGGQEDRSYHMPPPDLANLKRLESLTIHGQLINLTHFRGRYTTPLPWIANLLASLTKSPAFSDTFRSLHLELDLICIRSGGFGSLNWQELVDTLCDNFHKSQMRNISFKFWHAIGTDSEETALAHWQVEKINNDQLKHLQSVTGIVSIR
ncbi:hypothetical protein CVT24_001662 [Panaeolus cyanescens]|uniref:F-box domain-containing protein n=1 Tax=Panaeolus cyanescens TaxID=181874 RepID=A0A409VT33_9AGAR|nr:hypothetical protein CVT24_001662 [Panaeolus cyanescens]